MPKMPKLKVFCQSKKRSTRPKNNRFHDNFLPNGRHRPLINMTERSDTSNIGLLGILLVAIEILRLSFNGPGNPGNKVV